MITRFQPTVTGYKRVLPLGILLRIIDVTEMSCDVDHCLHLLSTP